MMSQQRENHQVVKLAPDRSPWQQMKFTYVGHVSKLVQGGGGKLSAPTGDPGEPFRKPTGQL